MYDRMLLDSLRAEEIERLSNMIGQMAKFSLITNLSMLKDSILGHLQSKILTWTLLNSETISNFFRIIAQVVQFNTVVDVLGVQTVYNVYMKCLYGHIA